MKIHPAFSLSLPEPQPVRSWHDLTRLLKNRQPGRWFGFVQLESLWYLQELDLNPEVDQQLLLQLLVLPPSPSFVGPRKQPLGLCW